jgi:PAS domain S-box-containing protein
MNTNQAKGLFNWGKSHFLAPVIYIGALLLILGILIYTIYHKANVEQGTDLKIQTERVIKNIEIRLNGNLDFINLIAKERTDGTITEQTFQSHVKHYLDDHPEFINITWVDSNFVINTVCPLAGNAHIIGLHIELPEPKRASNLARKNRKPTYTRPFEAIQGNSSFEVWVPVFKGEQFLGLIAGVYSSSNLLKQSLPVGKKYKSNFSLINENNEILTGFSEDDLAENGISYQASLSSLGNGMKVEVYMERAQPFTWLMTLLILFSFMLLTGFSFSLYKIKREMQMRHEFQESLKESEETYRMLFDSINDAAFVSEPDDTGKLVRFTKVNDVACQRLGYTREELVAKSPFDINSDNKKPGIPAFISKLLENGQAIIETEHVTKDGRIIPVEVSARVTRFNNRTIYHSIARDITERKQNELRIKEKADEIEAQNEEYQQINEELNQINEELHIAKNRAEASEANLTTKNEELKQTIRQLTDLENRLQFALMAGKLGTWDWDIQAGKILWSDLSKKMSGIPLDADVDYDYFISTVIPEERDKINNLVKEALEEKKDYNCEYRVKWSDGTIHWIRVMGRGIYNDKGVPVRMIGVGMEITESKLTEIALEHSHNLMSYIIQHNPSSIAVFDKELRYIYVSQRYMNDYKVDDPNIIGKYHYDLYPNLPQKFKDAHQKSLKGEIVSADDDPYYREDGTVDWTRWESRPWYEADGTIGGIIIYTELITERIQQKLELIAAKEKAEESDRLKTAFLQNMSHEIRTPMNAIMGFSSILTDNFDNKKKLEQYANIINQRGSDLLDIINDILDIAKIESGQLPVNLEECNIFELFNELTSFFTEYKKRLGKEHIDFRLKVNCIEEHTRIITDKVKLKQILINLITNAFKFTDNGKIEGSCKHENGKLFFYVSDSGIGIPKDKQTVVFERFSQLNQNPKKNIGGTGLGLPIVKGLVNVLGGEIFLESEPEKGSIFSFTIPFKVAVDEQKTVSHAPSDLKKMAEKSILIVEDDLYNAEYLKEILIDSHLKVFHTETGEEAVTIALSHRIDLVLMDVRLPDIDGYEATRQILRHKPYLKIVAQIAYASSDERQKALNAGCIDYISKPTKKATVLSVINNLLDTNESAPQKIS